MKKPLLLFTAFLLLAGKAVAVYFLLFSNQTLLAPSAVVESGLGGKVEQKAKVTLVAVGDVMLSRSVEERMRERNDYTYPFLKTADILRGADIAFGNLETPITEGEPARPAGGPVLPGEMMFRADPKVVEGLVYAGFDVLSLANNHLPDAGQKGLLDTFEYLDEVGISYVGAGEDDAKARRPVIKEVNGLSFAFLAYNDSDVVPPGYFASSDRAGTAQMNIETLREDISRVGDQADFVIISMHSGTEYAPEPNDRQVAFARAVIDAGATLVLGHHPHVVQTSERYKNGYIVYSLGNFVFDQMWSLETRQGLIAEFTFSQDGIEKADLTPVIIENYAQPRLVD
jgi:poly-gamma-glutamate synthesis protein (capsule biosynthesis protein)